MSVFVFISVPKILSIYTYVCENDRYIYIYVSVTMNTNKCVSESVTSGWRVNFMLV